MLYMLKLALLGDIGLIGKYSNEDKKFNEERIFSEVKEVLSNADIVVGNLESPLTNEKIKSGVKSVHIKTDPIDVHTLQYLGVDYLNLANNHIYDYGRKGVVETIQVLEENRIGYFGFNGKKVYIEKNGARLAINGYCCYSTNPIGLGKNNINPLEPVKIEEELKANKNEGYLSILSMHFGEEHIAYPNIDHIKVARKLSTITPYVLHGHHPHVLQGIEESEESLLIYSLGNFCFDHDYTARLRSIAENNTKPENLRTAIVLIDVENNKITNWDVIPFQVVEGILRKDDSGAILKDINQWSRALTNEEKVYKNRRSNELRKVKKIQVKKRDFLWYKKRMNLRTLRLMINNYRNKVGYKKNIKRYIGE